MNDVWFARFSNSWIFAGIVLFVICSSSGPALGDSVFFMADGNTSSLYEVNPTTGQAISVGSLGVFPNNALGLTYNPSLDVLYMTNSSGTGQVNSDFYTVNPSTGQATLVGDTGVIGLSGLAYDPTRNLLYGGAGFDDSLYVVDPSTGSATLIGSFGVAVGGQGLAFDSLRDELFMVDFISDSLYQLDTTTGAATLIGGTNLDSTPALAFNTDDGQLYGVNANNDMLVRFDSMTGTGTAVGSLGFDSFNIGLAFRASTVPEPSTSVALLVLCAGLAIRRRGRFDPKIEVPSQRAPWIA